MIVNTILFLFLGLICLFYGAKLTVISLENIAKKFGISHILIGLTILSIGTSFPEIAVSVMGAFDKVTGLDPTIDGIVIGNKVGSFFAQISLILGILGLTQAIFVSKWELKREGLMMIVALAIFFFCAMDGIISRIDAIIYIVSYFLFLIFIIWSEKKNERAEKEVRKYLALKEKIEDESSAIIKNVENKQDIPDIKNKVFRNLLIFLLGLTILLIGAELTVLNAHELAKILQIPQYIIGLFLVGVGTSLPELVADLTALKRKSSGIAIGDILGSNICDILLATGSGAIIVDFIVPPSLIWFDIPLLLGAIFLSLIFLWTDNTLTVRESLILIFYYSTYAILKIILFA